MDFRNGYFDSKTYNALNESIENEKRLRMNWNKRLNKINEKYPNKNYYTWTGMFDFVKNDEQNEKKFKLPEIKFPQRKVNYDSEIDDYLKRIGVKDDKSNILPNEMYSINFNTKGLLFQDKKIGRREYLRERGKLSPERRYKFPLCSSMDYGWRLSGSVENADKAIRSDHAMKNELINTFYRTNGVFNNTEY